MEPFARPALHDYEEEHIETVGLLHEEAAFLRAQEERAQAPADAAAFRTRRQTVTQRILHLVIAGNRVRDESQWGRQFLVTGK